MLISHEVPLELLEESRKFNDYDYCLLHLISQYPEYKDFYKKSVEMGRKVLLDNSLFELGDALSADQLIKGILELKPTWYVVPDCWEDAETTKQRFIDFQPHIKELPGIDIGVIQGDTMETLIDCYIFMRERASKIAIPFGIKAFEDVYYQVYGKSINDQTTFLQKLCRGRIAFIEKLIDNHIFATHKPHHLLGCTLASEYFTPCYSKYIESCDTSNPIIAGLNMQYYTPQGLSFKPLGKICDLMTTNISPVQKKCILHNVKIFRDIAEKQVLF